MIYKTLLIFSILLSNIFALDLLQEYQKKGIEALEKRLDQTLATAAYWKEALEDKNVSLGLYSNFKTILFCRKDKAKLSRISITEDHQLSLEHSNGTFLGQKNGDKQREGDLRTPVGVYQLTQKLTKVDPFYGPLALVTNYPNNFDRAQNKSGSGIWIHGLPLQGDRDDYTKGCLAIDNQELVALEKSVDYKKTALLISPNSTPSVSKDIISRILASLYEWRNAWKSSNLNKYLSFYDNSFKRPDGTSYTQFSIFKQQVFAKKEKKRIDFDYINVIPYPNENNESLFYIQFLENYESENVRFQGTKELYVRFDNDKISILTEN